MDVAHHRKALKALEIALRAMSHDIVGQGCLKALIDSERRALAWAELRRKDAKAA